MLRYQSSIPEPLVPLWAEFHPGVPVQLQLAAAA